MGRGRQLAIRSDENGTGGVEPSTAEIQVVGVRAAMSFEPLLTLREVAALLRVHEKTVCGWVRRRDLPCIRLGGRLRFDQRDVLRWIAARKEG